MAFSNNEILDMIVKAGLRPSAQRMAVLGYIGNRRTHPTADEIFNALAKDFPSLSLTTVYNSVNALLEVGLLREIHVDATSKRYDLAPLPQHSHFICKRCGKIFDMPYPLELKIASTDGFDVENIDVHLIGTCPDCKAKNNS